MERLQSEIGKCSESLADAAPKKSVNEPETLMVIQVQLTPEEFKGVVRLFEILLKIDRHVHQGKNSEKKFIT